VKQNQWLSWGNTGETKAKKSKIATKNLKCVREKHTLAHSRFFAVVTLILIHITPSNLKVT